MCASPAERWFVGVLVFESQVEGAWCDPSVDVQYRLIRAVDAETAYQRALALGKREENSYENPYGQTCRWVFKGLGDLQKVLDEELGHGVEIYGFIQKDSAEDWVVEKGQLTVFLGRDEAAE